MQELPYAAVIFDLDGTVYRGDELIPGAAEVVAMLREAGIEVMFLTNKAIERRSNYSEKLTRLGIPTDREEIINSGWVTAQFVRTEYPDRRAFVVGEGPLVAELEAAGIETTTESVGDLVVASMDRQFTYEKLDVALQSLGDDEPFIATNPDRTCPVADGEIPDAAGMIRAIEGVSGREVDAVLGKPSPVMVETVVEALGVDPAACLMVGDRPETDIAMGNRAGMDTALVLSGVTSSTEVGQLDENPAYILESIGEFSTVYDPAPVVTDE